MKKQANVRTIRFDDELSLQYEDAEPSYYLYRIVGTDELVQVEMAFGEQLRAPGAWRLHKNYRKSGRGSLPRGGVGTGRIHSAQQNRGARRAKWPMTCVNGGVNPNQINELRQFWKENGVRGCEVLPNGDVRYSDRAARKADHAKRGLYDRSGGYGDQAPQNL